MFTVEKVKQLENQFKRIFSMPITRSTFREMQNSILSISPEYPEVSSILFESLITGQIKNEKVFGDALTSVKQLINDYSVQARLCRDVYERGEFISLASSDIISQPNKISFLNRFRRLDGEELHFLTDTKGTINLVQHLLSRVQELQKSEQGREALKEQIEEIKDILRRAEKLIIKN